MPVSNIIVIDNKDRVKKTNGTSIRGKLTSTRARGRGALRGARPPLRGDTARGRFTPGSNRSFLERMHKGQQGIRGQCRLFACTAVWLY